MTFLSPRGGRGARATAPFLLALAGAAFLGTAGCEREPRRVVLGIAMGTSLVDAARLAVEDELSAAPLPGFDTLVVPEGSARSGPALQAALALTSTPGLVAVVGHTNSAASLVASQVYNERGVVQVAPTSTAAAYSSAGPFSFRLVPPDPSQGRFLASVVAEAFPEGARMALFFVNDDYGRGLRSAILDAADPERFPPVLQMPHVEEAVGATEVQRGLDALAHAQPEVFLWLGRPAVLQAFLPGLRARWPDLPIYGSDALATAPTLDVPAPLWAGIHFADFLDPLGTEEARAFAARFEARFGDPAAGPHLLTYDAVRVLMQGLRAGASSGEELRAYLASLGRETGPFQGVSGPVAFDENGDVERQYVLRRFDEGLP